METQTETPTEETQVDASQLNAAAGAEADAVVTATTNADTLSLSEINEITGMSYKDKETALKSIKDMKSQAGKAADLEGKIKAAQAAPSTSNDELATLKEKLNQTQLEVFYSNNPQYRANKELLETIAKANGMTAQEAAETDLFKNTVAKEPEKRTVAQPSSKIAPSGDKPFNAADHSGDADALARFVAQTYLTK